MGEKRGKGKSVQLGLWKLHPVKLLELRERREGLKRAGRRHGAVARREGLVKAQTQPLTGGTFCLVVSFGFTVLTNVYVRCFSCKRVLWCHRNPALSYHHLPKRKGFARI